MPSYLSLSLLKTQLGILNTAQDTYLNLILNSVEANIKTYLGFDPLVTDILEYADSWGTPTVYLRRQPVVSVEHVYENPNGNYGQGDDPFPANTELVQGTDFVLVKDHTDNWCIRRLNRVWPWLWYRQPTAVSSSLGRYPGCIKIEYTVDNTDVMYICSEAGQMEAIARYRLGLTGTGVVTSDSMDGASVSVNNWRRNPYNERADSRDQFVSPVVSTMLHPLRAVTSFFVS